MSSYDLEAGFQAFLDAVIPPDNARGLPGGSEVGFRPSVSAMDCMRIFDDAAMMKSGRRFYELDSVEKSNVVSCLTRAQKIAVRRFAKELAEVYYMNPIVTSVIEFGERPPFPIGYQIEDGDLTLLKPVYLGGKIYREV